jgi:hypothetical protein
LRTLGDWRAENTGAPRCECAAVLLPGLVALWDGLTRDVRAAPYRLELAHLDGREECRDVTSLSGSYSVGDLIPAPAGECWQVVGVEPEEDGQTRLMCDPC